MFWNYWSAEVMSFWFTSNPELDEGERSLLLMIHQGIIPGALHHFLNATKGDSMVLSPLLGRGSGLSLLLLLPVPCNLSPSSGVSWRLSHYPVEFPSNSGLKSHLNRHVKETQTLQRA